MSSIAHSKKPLALKFNVGKKLGQLMKVIQFFESQLAEMQYQRNFIHLTYDPLLQELMDNYTKEASSVSEQLEQETQAAAQKIEKQFQAKEETLKSDLNSYIQAAENQVNKFESTANDQILKLHQNIEKLNQLIGTENSNFEKSVDVFARELDTAIASEKDKHQKELKSLQQESEEKLNKMKAQFEEKMKELEDEFNKSKEEILNPSTGQVPGKKQKEIQKKIDALHQQIVNLKTDIRKMKANVNDLLDHNKVQSAQIKEQVKGLTTDMANAETDKSKIIQMKQEEKELMENNYRNKIETQNSILEQNKEKHKEELQDARSKAKQESDQMKIKYSDESQRIREEFDNLDDYLQKLVERQNEELEKLKQKHDQYRQASQLKMKEKSQEVELMIQDNEREKKSLEDELNNLAQKLEQDKAELENKRQQWIKDENDRFQKAQEELLGLRKESENGEESSKLHKQELSALLEEISKLRTQFNDEITAYEQETEKQLNDLKNENETSLNAHKVANQAEFESFKSQFAEKLEELNKQQDKEYEELKERLKKEMEMSIEDFQKKGLDRKEITDFVQQYKLLFDKESQKLSEYDDVKVDTDFSVLDNEIKMLNVEFDQNKEKHETEKSNIDIEWTEKLAEEDKRHLAAMASSPDNSKEATKTKILKELEEEKQNRMRDESDLNAQISDEIMRHKKEFEELNNKKSELLNRSEIDELEEKCKQHQLELEELIKMLSESEQHKKDQHEKNIEAEKEGFQKAQQELAANESEILQKIQKDKEDLENDRETSLQREQQSLENAKDLAQKTLQLENRDFQREKDRLLKDIEDAKKQQQESAQSVDKALLSNRSRRESEEIVFMKEKKAEIEQIKKDWTTMDAFYEEKINVLHERVEKGRNRMATLSPRPQEVELIEKLTADLSLVTYRLKNAAIELKNSHELTMTQEKVYNAKFGKSPKIGVGVPVQSKSSLK